MGNLSFPLRLSACLYFEMRPRELISQCPSFSWLRLRCHRECFSLISKGRRVERAPRQLVLPIFGCPCWQVPLCVSGHPEKYVLKHFLCSFDFWTASLGESHVYFILSRNTQVYLPFTFFLKNNYLEWSAHIYSICSHKPGVCIPLWAITITRALSLSTARLSFAPVLLCLPPSSWPHQ